MNLEDLVNDALYNLKNPIVTTTTEESSRIMMLTTSTTEIPPPLSVSSTIATTRQEETGFDDDSIFEEDDENEYYDDVYVTTALDDSDELQSSKVGSDDFNKILSTIEKSTPNTQQEQVNDIKHNKKGTKDKARVKLENDDSKSSLFSMAGFLPLLKDIQETLTKNNKQTTSSKVELLENIRDQLLANINYRMNALWGGGGNKVGNRNRSKSTIIRERRAARTLFQDKEHDDHHHDHHYEEHEYEHHVDFPSNAAALLALSFLTFAVFLIKLVLQVIQALQAKAQNMTTTTTSATIIRLKRSEEEEYENAARILNYIDTFSIK
ncbi:uncharacterized protein LOC123293459 [Chrysoperla carnea]|uniref:uncharacterized protein LOC123293459 n=1 Tax=Chrysoperla carnea TaxID=189513 RepID=UPI001D076489|nr:uncharacterized protein LOC123293459 [Chrysoperla carnea]